MGPTRHTSKDIVLTHAILFSVNANQMYEQIPEISRETVQLMTEICARGVIEHACREIKKIISTQSMCIVKIEIAICIWANTMYMLTDERFL